MACVPKRGRKAPSTLAVPLIASPEQLSEIRQILAGSGAPAEILQAFDDPQSALEMLQMLETMAEQGPASPEELLEGWRPLLEPGFGPLDAELSGCEFVGMFRMMAPDDDDLPHLLLGLIAQAEAYAKPEALAMLRSLAAVGPPSVRPEATAAADRMVAAGQPDPSWAKEIGSPEFVSAFGYGDVFGLQETLVVEFRYGRKAHAIAVLIDHDLGGGVKDCWLTDQSNRIRKQVRQMVRAAGVELRKYSRGEAQEILERALRSEPCPVQPDQIEDVRDYLELLRWRLALLDGDVAVSPALDSGVPSPRAKERPKTVHRIKVTLRGSKPPIWRRLEVDSRITLLKLHMTIQAVFGWEDCHMWVFETSSGSYGVADRELGHRSAGARKLADVAPKLGDRIRYIYDFGDNWEHDIVVEDVAEAEAGATLPRCLAGKRACPPEDCGGMWGYQELLAILADPSNEEHAGRREWLGLESGDEFDPAAFDLEQANDMLSGMAHVLTRA